MTSHGERSIALRRYRRQNRGFFFIGAITVFVGLRFFFDSHAVDQSAIGRALPGVLDEAWSMLYVVGGALMAYGCERPSPRAERPGITLLLTGLAMNVVAILGDRGVVGLTVLPPFAIAIWVLWSRRVDLIEIGRIEREKTQQRLGGTLTMLALPVIIPLAAQIDLTSILVAIMGGGIVTAIANALLFKPQRSNLLSQAADSATAAAERMLERADKDITRLEKKCDEQMEIANALKTRNKMLLATVEEQGLTIARYRDEVHECANRIEKLEARLAS